MNKLIKKNRLLILLSCLISACSTDEKTTGFWQEMHTDIPFNTGIQRNGQQIYQYKCYECHDRNTQGAPMQGDNYEWNRRYQKGLDVLVNHAISGFNKGLMPSRGGCRDCTEEELKSAVIFMLHSSGIEINNINDH